MSRPRLLETMRAEGGRIDLLGRHLDRLASSAAALGYALDPAAVRRRLAAALGTAPPVAGVRLTVGPAGDVDLEVWPLDSPPFSTACVDPEPWPWAGTPRCVHKTTDRDHYERRYGWARDVGADEAILVDPEGRVVEGTRTTIWVEEGGRWWTPPLRAGGLAGVMRAHVLATRPEAGERPLRVADLETATSVALTNALRGWMPVRLR